MLLDSCERYERHEGKVPRGGCACLARARVASATEQAPGVTLDSQSLATSRTESSNTQC